MNLNKTYWMFWKFLLAAGAAVQLMFPLATASEILSDLTCNVTNQPDGLFIYQLSRPTSSSSCTTCWENKTSNVIARDSSFHPVLVQKLTNQSIVLKDCMDYLHFTKNCDGAFEEAHCRINCSLLNENLLQTTVNSTQTCRSWCPDQMTIGLSITVILLVAGAFVGVYFWKLCKRRRSVTMTTSYTPANEQIKMERVQSDHRMDIV